MNNQQDRDALLLEKLERLLAGEDIKIQEMPDEELRAVIQFAEKMVALRQLPTFQFKAQLKARLLKELVEREEKARAQRAGWLWKLVPRGVVWQAVTAFTVLLVIGGMLWGMGVFTPAQEGFIITQEAAPARDAALSTTALPTALGTTSPPAPLVASAPSEKSAAVLSVSTVTDKSLYMNGETVKITISFTNRMPQPVKLDKYPPVINIKNSETGQAVYTFDEGNIALTLGANETVQYIVSLELTAGRLPPGIYIVETGNVEIQGQAGGSSIISQAQFQVQ